MDARTEHQRATFADRLLVEAVECHTSLRDLQPEDRLILEELAEATPAPQPEQELIDYSAASPHAAELRNAIDRWRRVLLAVVAAGALIAIILGGAAARAALSDQTASVFGLVAGLLGVQTLLLLVWAVVILVRPRAAGAVVGGATVGIAARVARRRTPAHAGIAATRAMGRVASRSSVGSSLLSFVTHAMWASANVGMVIVMAASFLGEGYRFRWDSTWLDDESYSGFIQGFAVAPAQLGFPVPDEEAIALSRRPADAASGAWSDESRETWAWLFFGSVITYGLLPRTVLMVVCFAWFARARRRYRVDDSLPGHARVLRSIDRHRRVRIASGVRGAPAEPTRPAFERAQDNRPVGDAAIIGVEIDRPGTGWPPRIATRLRDLGIIDGGAGVHAVARLLAEAAQTPRAILIVCDVGASPDRGMARTLGEILAETGAPAHLVLTGGRRIAKESDREGIVRRVEAWRDLARQLGINENRVVELDLDHATDATRGLLSRMAAASAPEGGTEGGFGQVPECFELIAEHSRAWKDTVSAEQQLEVHQAVARLFRHEPQRWRALMPRLSDWRDLSQADVTERARSVASQVRALLPASLKTHTRWAAAGGIAGAVGCVAAATLVAPAAIAGLPAWAITGAAIAAATRLTFSAAGPDAVAELPGAPFEEAISAAVLFAMVLDLQPAPEAMITRVLERTLEGAPEPTRGDSDNWLRQIQSRYLAATSMERPDA